MQISLQPISELKPASDIVEISLFGPGVGECVVLHVGDGKWFIIDSCMCRDSREPIALEYLRRLKVDLENDVIGFLITHWHADHTGGALKIVETCTRAKIYIPYSLTAKETITFALLHKEDQISESTKSISEFREILQYLAKAQSRNRLTQVKQEHSFFNDPANAKRIISLSPSDVAINRACEAIASMMPAKGGQRTVPVKSNPNHNAVAIIFSFGQFSALLGSDLELTVDDGAGWSAILKDEIISRQSIGKSQLYKIAHHGSVTADARLIWDELLEKNPLVIGTCFSRSRLPKPDDIERILKNTNNFFVSSKTSEEKKPKREVMVEKEMGILLERKVLRKTMGHLQIRASSQGILSVSGSDNVEHHMPTKFETQK